MSNSSIFLYKEGHKVNELCEAEAQLFHHMVKEFKNEKRGYVEDMPLIPDLMTATFAGENTAIILNVKLGK